MRFMHFLRNRNDRGGGGNNPSETRLSLGKQKGDW